MFQSALLVGSLVLLVAVLRHFGSSANEWTWERLLIILGMLPVGLLWIARNRPRQFDPAAVPEELLPSKPAPA